MLTKTGDEVESGGDVTNIRRGQEDFVVLLGVEAGEIGEKEAQTATW